MTGDALAHGSALVLDLLRYIEQVEKLLAIGPLGANFTTCAGRARVGR